MSIITVTYKQLVASGIEAQKAIDTGYEAAKTFALNTYGNTALKNRKEDESIAHCDAVMILVACFCHPNPNWIVNKDPKESLGMAITSFRKLIRNGKVTLVEDVWCHSDSRKPYPVVPALPDGWIFDSNADVVSRNPPVVEDVQPSSSSSVDALSAQDELALKAAIDQGKLEEAAELEEAQEMNDESYESYGVLQGALNEFIDLEDMVMMYTQTAKAWLELEKQRDAIVSLLDRRLSEARSYLPQEEDALLEEESDVDDGSALEGSYGSDVDDGSALGDEDYDYDDEYDSEEEPIVETSSSTA
jgi:hypothetical protein